MEDGRVIAKGTPQEIPEEIDKKCFLPTAAYIFREAGFNKIPVSVKHARDLIENKVFTNECTAPKRIYETRDLIKIKNLSFEYERGRKVLKDINLSIKRGEITAVMGENGAGKSTLFKILSGLIENFTGEATINDKKISDISTIERLKTVGYLSQNPNDYLGRDTVFDEVAYSLRNIGEFSKDRVQIMLEKLDLSALRSRNPRDLSGGEKQRTAIACTLVTNPEILILEEPTRGMDSISKEKLGTLLRTFTDSGKAVIIKTHDSDFAGDFADTVVLMFDGQIITSGSCSEILSDSIFYSPQVARIFNNKCKVVKTEKAIELLRVVR
jgi:energy-coupling factor transport system ATP-binding protein